MFDSELGESKPCLDDFVNFSLNILGGKGIYLCEFGSQLMECLLITLLTNAGSLKLYVCHFYLAWNFAWITDSKSQQLCGTFVLRNCCDLWNHCKNEWYGDLGCLARNWRCENPLGSTEPVHGARSKLANSSSDHASSMCIFVMFLDCTTWWWDVAGWTCIEIAPLLTQSQNKKSQKDTLHTFLIVVCVTRCAALFLWRRRHQNKNLKERREKSVLNKFIKNRPIELRSFEIPYDIWSNSLLNPRLLPQPRAQNLFARRLRNAATLLQDAQVACLWL